MADSILCDEIIVKLEERGFVRVDRPCDFKSELGINSEWSNTQIKRALGSLISRGKVLRHRAELQSCSDNGQPVTYRFAHS